MGKHVWLVTIGAMVKMKKVREVSIGSSVILNSSNARSDLICISLGLFV